jgi:hypothetical protein
MATKKTNETEAKAVEKEELVSVLVPYIEGQDPEVTVIINGQVTKFKKGVTVKVKPNVAEVLENSNQQMMAAFANQKKFEKQVMDL